jgi:hypothetical protein
VAEEVFGEVYNKFFRVALLKDLKNENDETA